MPSSDHSWLPCAPTHPRAPKPLLQVLLEPPLLRRRPALFELYADEASGGFTRHHLLSTLRQAYGHARAEDEQEQQREWEQQWEQQREPQREPQRECPAAVAAPLAAHWSAESDAQQQPILVGMQRRQQGHWVPIVVS